MTRPSGRVVVDVPARTRSLRLLRLAVADATSELATSLEGIESARIAVDELASLLLATGTWDRIRLTLEPSGTTLRVTGVLQGTAADRRPVEPDPIVEELMAVCVAAHGIDDGDVPSFWFVVDPRGGTPAPPQPSS